MIKARASSSKVYLYFMEKSRQVRHCISRNSCFILPNNLKNLDPSYKMDSSLNSFDKMDCSRFWGLFWEGKNPSHGRTMQD